MSGCIMLTFLCGIALIAERFIQKDPNKIWASAFIYIMYRRNKHCLCVVLVFLEKYGDEDVLSAADQLNGRHHRRLATAHLRNSLRRS